ncbi:MAG: hypothetical protein GTO22_25925 [Gemmatimonadales bacterium]|nr:hypothetical protein [Gemmatimonadales bacterium]
MRAILLTALLVAPALAACSKVVYLSPQRYSRLPGDAEIRIIDATDMSRSEIEGVLGDHEILARYSARVRAGNGYRERLGKVLEEGKQRARDVGGDVLLHTRNSELIATIVRDARYAGASDAVVIYVLRSKQNPQAERRAAPRQLTAASRKRR